MPASIRPGSGEARTSPTVTPGSRDSSACRTRAWVSPETGADAGAVAGRAAGAVASPAGSAAQAARLAPRARERIRLRFMRKFQIGCGVGPQRGPEVRDSRTVPAAPAWRPRLRSGARMVLLVQALEAFPGHQGVD